MAADNKTIGRFHLDGIPPAPRGVPQIEVSFDIDANGIIKVSATDKGTGKSRYPYRASSGLTAEEIERMKKDAEANADSDRIARERVEKLEADGMIFQTESQLKELGEKLSDSTKRLSNMHLTELNGTPNQDLTRSNRTRQDQRRLENCNRSHVRTRRARRAATRRAAARGSRW
jgi:molecular chaperone DnaK